jgi:hypothetical protein
MIQLHVLVLAKIAQAVAKTPPFGGVFAAGAKDAPSRGCQTDPEVPGNLSGPSTQCIYANSVPIVQPNQSAVSAFSILCIPICNLSATGKRPQAAIPGPWARAQGQPRCS